MPRTPPEDPAEWDDDEWLAWLEEVELEAPDAPDRPAWRRSKSVPVAMLGAAMLGMHRAIYGDQEPDIVMIVEADGDPPDPERLEVRLDPEDPDASTVTVRPWLDDDDPEGEAGASPPAAEGTPTGPGDTVQT